MEPTTSIVATCQQRALHDGARIAFQFLLDGELDGRVESIDYRTLDQRARTLAAHLQATLDPGDRVLLLFAPGLDYIAAFFACLYAGVVAVPAYPPDPARLERSLPRLRAIVEDCEPSLVLSMSWIEAAASRLSSSLSALRWLAIDRIDADPSNWTPPTLGPDQIALLQYTSGSTRAPRGVMVSHANLVGNAAQTARAFDVGPETIMVSWLPPYHDMGLMGTILQPVFSGYRSVLMAPQAFLQRPRRWLEAISGYAGTLGGGPNFGYELCVRKVDPEQLSDLDLSAWRVAFNGAEPVRADTLDRFARTFARCGLRRETLFPCYGLAETTLFATSAYVDQAPRRLRVDEGALASLRVVPSSEGRTLVSCGRPWLDQEVRIVDPQTHAEAAPGTVAEIWLRSSSCARGYWGRPESSDETFGARLASGDGPFLRTGDLGFVHEGELYVNGRIKDVIVVRGRNLWPQDIEYTVERCNPAIRSGSCAAFALDEGDAEAVGVLAEVRTNHDVDLPALAREIRGAVAREHGVMPSRVALADAGTLPKTSSGKIQRFACRRGLAGGSLALRYDLQEHERAALPMSLLFFSSQAEAPAGAGEEHDLYGLFLAAAKLADDEGFEAVWIPERHFHPFGGLFPNPATLAAAVATTTERVKIRAGSVVMPLHDPLRVAEEWAVIDHLSRGRAGVAFAIGWNPNDYVLAPERYEGRKEATYSGIEEVRRLWSGEPTTRTNGQGQSVEVRVYPRPRTEPPLWLTCSGSIERFVEAGERGFNVLTALLFQTPEQLALKISAYREARTRAGLDPRSGHVTVMMHAFVAEDAAAVDAAVEEPLARYLASSVDLWRQRAEPLDTLSPNERESVLAFAAQRYRRDSALIGTPQACTRMLERARAAGADEIACLVDFGIDPALVLQSLPLLASVGRGERVGDPSPQLPPTTSSAPEAPAADPSGSVEATVRAIARCAAQALDLDPGLVPADPSARLTDLGLDSLLAVELSAQLGAELGVVVPSTLLFGDATFAELAASIIALRHRSRDGEAPAVDLHADTELPPQIDSAGKPRVTWPEAGPRRILLTGATGFLGAFLLAELLERTEAEVLCLVRASDPAHAGRRIRESLVGYGLWRETWRERFVPVCGDLAAPRLGLDEPRFDELAANLDAIVHNGALVNFAYTYASCRPANVLGTLEVLRLACHGPRLVPLHYISTTAVFSHAYAGGTVGPADQPEKSEHLDMGYTQSKWVAERLVLAARERGLPVAVDRPGLITGAQTSGATDPSNFVWSLIRVSVEIGVLPDYERVLDMTPVDWAAAVVVDGLLAQGACRGQLRHLVNQSPVSLRWLAQWLRERGHPVELASFERWQVKLIQKVTATPSLSALRPVLSLAAADFYERRQVRFDAPEAATPFVASGRECPPADRTLLDTYHDWFVAHGQLPAPGRPRAHTLAAAHEVLDAARIREQVVEITGLGDLGGDDWLEPLEVLLDDMRRQSYQPGGLERATMRLVTTLIRRAQLVELRHRIPAIAEVEIRRPLFIAAPPRTGTTLLHNLLSCDPANRTFALWEMLSPVTPQRATQGWQPHMIRVADELVAETYERSPALRAIHPLAAQAPDECHWLLANSMASQVLALMAHAPGYTQWLLHADLRRSYEFYRAGQQALLWRTPGQRLVAKDPWHLWHLDTLLETHPSATIVLLHRDMCEVVPSRSSLSEHLIRVEAEPPPPEVLGRTSLDLLDEGLRRMMAVRETRSDAFVDFGYRELARDPLAVVEAIYAHQGWSLTDDTRKRMRAWLDAHPAGRHGKHRYTLADFGLSTDAVRERFADYEARLADWLAR